MNAFELANELYEDGELAQIMEFCATNGGFVYSNSECFVCACPTKSTLIDIKSKKELDKPDTWYVFIASGNLKRAFDLIPPLEFIAYERFDESNRLISFDRMRRLIWVIQADGKQRFDI